MGDPSLIDYARHFGLTKRFDNATAHTLLSQTALRLPALLRQQLITNDECSGIFERFDQERKLLEQVYDHSPLQISSSAFEFLLLCRAGVVADIGLAYCDCLPKQRSANKLKIEEPLLIIGSGDATNDADRVQNGLDCQFLLRHIADNHTPKCINLDMADIASSFVAAEPSSDTLEANSRALRILCDVACPSIDHETKVRALVADLPPRRSCTVPDIPVLLEPAELEEAEPNKEQLMLPKVIIPTWDDVEKEYNQKSTQFSHMKAQNETDIYTIGSDDMNLASTNVFDYTKNAHSSPHSSKRERDQDSCLQEDDMKTHPSRNIICLQQEGCLSWQFDKTDELKPGFPIASQSQQARSGLKKMKLDVPKLEECAPPRTEDNTDIFLRRLAGNPYVSTSQAYQAPKAEKFDRFQGHAVASLKTEDIFANRTTRDIFLTRPQTLTRSGHVLSEEPEQCLLERERIVDDEISIAEADLKELSGESGHPQDECDNRFGLRVSVQQACGGIKTGGSEEKDYAFSMTMTQSRSQQLSLSTAATQPENLLKLSLTRSGRERSHFTQRSPINKTAILSNLHQEMQRTDLASGSLNGFLRLIGRSEYSKPAHQENLGTVKTAAAPIEVAVEQRASGMDCTDVFEIQPAAERDCLMPEGQELQPLDSARYVIINNVLLKSRPPLVRFLEQQSEAGFLRLIYRDFDESSLFGRGPDLILNPWTCVVVTNLQSLDQRSLPGAESQGGLSYFHDRLTELTTSFLKVFVIIHYGIADKIGPNQKYLHTVNDFAAYCQNISASFENSSMSIIPVVIQCLQSEKVIHSLTNWIWHLISSHGGCGRDEAPSMLVSAANLSLVQEESPWEMLLTRMGPNPFAAQIVLSKLGKLNSQHRCHVAAGSGLRKFVQISAEERHTMLCKMLGKEIVIRANAVLNASI